MHGGAAQNPATPAKQPDIASSAVLHLQRTAGNAAVQQLLSGTYAGLPDPAQGRGPPPVQRQPRPTAPPAKSSTETLNEQITSGKFKDALEFLNGRSMEDMIFHVEKVGFANASYLLANLGAAAWLGPRALGRLEVGIRSVGIRQTGTTSDLLIPLLDALKRSGVREFSDQLAAIRRNVMPPAGGWPTLVQQHLAMADIGPFVVLTAVDNAFRVLDFVTDGDMSQVLATLNEQQLRLLIVNNKSADRYDGERIRRGLDAAWRSRFPLVEPPWPKAVTAGGLKVSTMSTMDKLAEAIRRSEKYGGEELQGKLTELLSPQSLAMMAGTVILFAVLEASTAGAAGVALVALSVAMIGPEVYQVVGDINGFITTAAGATDEEALDRAGQYFAKAAVAISVDVLVAVLLHKPTKAATPRIQATARAAGEFLTSRTAPTGGRPSGELIPALAIASDGTPRFVQAPPERLTALESTGGGKGTGPADTPPAAYDQMSLQQLRKLARTDKAAADALVDRYRVMSDAELRKRASAGDETARAVRDQRISPNDADLARALGSDYRPPHSARIMIRRQGAGEIFRGQLTSGNMTAQEAALGYPRNSLATHTEARAVRRPELQAGDHLVIDGQYDPCSSCQRAMFTASRWLGITIEYRWSGGTMRFP
jgi:Pput_2613-like deaminase